MSEVVFYEKPGCIGNQSQKARLLQHGCRLIVKDLLSTDWTSTELREFFNHSEVSQWFNQSAPDIKSGKLNTADLTEQQALQLMCRDPILIRRPLLCYNHLKQAGFTAGPVLNELGIPLSADEDGCPMSGTTSNTGSDATSKSIADNAPECGATP